MKIRKATPQQKLQKLDNSTNLAQYYEVYQALIFPHNLEYYTALIDVRRFTGKKLSYDSAEHLG